MNDRMERTRNCWVSMKQRCLNANDPSYKHYGGRGISFCDRWKSFSAFLEDMGLKPDGLSIDRIDNEKGYSKENCRWADRFQQSNNQRSTVLLEKDGITMSMAQWARRLGINKGTLRMRHISGMPVDKVLFAGKFSTRNKLAKSFREGEPK